MKIYVVIWAVLIHHVFPQQCPVTNQGHFFKKIIKDSDVDNNVHDQPTLDPEFFDCGVKDSCTHVVKFSDTNTHEIVHGEAELKSIKRPIIVWEKQVEKPKKEWIVFQRRVDASVDFRRTWADYKSGFGNPSGNFWLGLEKLHCLACPGKGAILNITMKHRSYPDKLFYAAYTLFEIGNEADGYRLKIGEYSGNAGDSLRMHNGMKFSTKDRDNDVAKDYHCASQWKGAWWYRACQFSNLNGLYSTHRWEVNPGYMSWYTIESKAYGSYDMSEMKVKSVAKNCGY